MPDRLSDTINLRVTAAQRTHLERLAAETDEPVSRVVRRLIGVALEQLEAKGKS